MNLARHIKNDIMFLAVNNNNNFTCDNVPSSLEFRLKNFNYGSIDEGTCFPIFNFGNPNINLAHPIIVNISYVNDEYIGSIDELSIFEYADSFDELIEAVKGYLSILFDELCTTKKKLSKSLSEQKKFILSKANI